MFLSFLFLRLFSSFSFAIKVHFSSFFVWHFVPFILLATVYNQFHQLFIPHLFHYILTLSTFFISFFLLFTIFYYLYFFYYLFVYLFHFSLSFWQFLFLFIFPTHSHFCYPFHYVFILISLYVLHLLVSLTSFLPFIL